MTKQMYKPKLWLATDAELSSLFDSPCWLGSSTSISVVVVTFIVGVLDESVGKVPETFHETGSVDGSQLMPRL